MNLILRDQELSWGNNIFPCAWGREGIRSAKVEGDGATPTGCFPFRRVFYRPDRIEPPQTHLPLKAISLDDGWCDDPTDLAYNQLISLPYPARHEKLWREDSVYDLILVVGYNDDPVISGKGSAIFVHLIRPQATPTQGCVALSQENLLKVLQEAKPESCLIVES